MRALEVEINAVHKEDELLVIFEAVVAAMEKVCVRVCVLARG